MTLAPQGVPDADVADMVNTTLADVDIVKKADSKAENLSGLSNWKQLLGSMCRVRLEIK